MSDSDKPLLASADAVAALSIEVARFTRTLGEIERFGVGDVLVTGQKVGGTATVRTAEQAVAEGELVAVGEDVGIRITRALDRA
jgi:type III secretion protein Q